MASPADIAFTAAQIRDAAATIVSVCDAILASPHLRQIAREFGRADDDVVNILRRKATALAAGAPLTMDDAWDISHIVAPMIERMAGAIALCQSANVSVPLPEGDLGEVLNRSVFRLGAANEVIHAELVNTDPDHVPGRSPDRVVEGLAEG